jgi:hypothetical protein
VTPHARLLKLPSFRPGATRGPAALATATKLLQHKGLLRLVSAAIRPRSSGIPDAVSAPDATFLHTGGGDGKPRPRLNWSRLALRRWLWRLTLKEARLLTWLVATFGVAGYEPFLLIHQQHAA